MPLNIRNSDYKYGGNPAFIFMSDDYAHHVKL